MKVRLFGGRVYVVKRTKGISGFQQWGQFDTFLMLGAKARTNYRLDVTGEYQPGTYQKFKIEDGHLVAFCPPTDEAGAMGYLREHPWATIRVCED